MAKDQDLESSVEGVGPLRQVKEDVAHTGYADAVKEFNMTRDSREVLDVIGRGGVLLDRAIAPSSIAQNRDKAEHNTRFYGPGQDVHAKELQREMKAAGLGRVQEPARYLGGRPQANGGVNVTCGCFKAHSHREGGLLQHG